MLGRVLDEAAAQDELLQRGGNSNPDASALLLQKSSSIGGDSTTSSSNGGPSNNSSRKKQQPQSVNYGSTAPLLPPSGSSNSSMVTTPARRHNSGVESTLEGAASDYDDDDDEDDSETLDGFDDELLQQQQQEKGFFGCCVHCWNCLRFLADVENVWDSPSADTSWSHSRRRRKTLLLAFWFMVLATSYAGERSTFKFLVDESGPFRLFSVEMVTAIHAILLGVGLLISWCLHKRQLEQQHRSSGGGPPERLGTQFELPLGLPIVDVGLMALLDVVGLMLVFLTGIYVSPTNTVILVQFVLPLMACLMQFVHPKGRCAVCRTGAADGALSDATSATSPLSPGSPHHQRNNSRTSNYSSGSGSHYSQSPELEIENFNNNNNHNFRPIPNCAGLAVNHLTGAALIFFACLLALIPSFYTIIDPDFFRYADSIPLRVAYNTLFFLSSCIPAAASQLYKEHVFLQYKQPVNVHKVNLLLSAFQFVFVSVLSPLVFTLQGLGSEDAIWYTLYPSSEFSDNFVDGLACFFWQLDEDDQLVKYPEKANCEFVLFFAIVHALCIIMVGVAVDKLVSAGSTKMTHRGISAGIILAVVGMAIYDFRIPQFNYGPFVDGLNLLCVIMIIMGSEVYHRVTNPDSTFTTVYPSLDNIYEED